MLLASIAEDHMWNLAVFGRIADLSQEEVSRLIENPETVIQIDVQCQSTDDFLKSVREHAGLRSGESKEAGAGGITDAGASTSSGQAQFSGSDFELGLSQTRPTSDYLFEEDGTLIARQMTSPKLSDVASVETSHDLL